jgi:hypothetical protein
MSAKIGSSIMRIAAAIPAILILNSPVSKAIFY